MFYINNIIKINRNEFYLILQKRRDTTMQKNIKLTDRSIFL